MNVEPVLGSHQVPARHWGVLHRQNRDRVVGVLSTSYGSEKVTYGLPIRSFQFRKLYTLPLYRLKHRSTFFKYTPIPLDRSIPLIHGFNEIPISNHKFLVSFENELPRYFGNVAKWQFERGLNLLSSDRCVGLLALSKQAAKLAKRRFQDLDRGDISEKVQVFRGGLEPARIRVGEVTKPSTGPIRILFVGRTGFAKGLMPLLDAIDRCRESGIEVELTTICSFGPEGSYVLQEFEPDASVVRERLFKTPYIIHHEYMQNSEVRLLMRNADALAFPTLDESLGWVAVEAALERLPVITTDVFALPELIEHDRSGYVIPIPLGADSRWRGIWLSGWELQEAIYEVYHILEEGLCDAIGKVADDREKASILGQNAFNHIDALYNPINAAMELEAIYDSCI